MPSITVEALVHADIQKVWDCWTMPAHIQEWNQASSDWECPHAENDLRVDGRFLFRMSAKDGSTGFDFNGVYTTVIPQKEISYTMEGGRKVGVLFTEDEAGTRVTETFELENTNPEEKQRTGWQSILNNFKAHVESN